MTYDQIIAKYFPDVTKQYIGGSDGDPGEDQWIGGDRARGAAGIENWNSIFDQMGNVAASHGVGVNISPERRIQILEQMAQSSPTGTVNINQAGQYLTPQENQALQQWNQWAQEQNSKMSFGDYLAQGAFMAGTAAMGGAALGMGPIAAASGTAGSGGVLGASAPSWLTGADASWGVNAANTAANSGMSQAELAALIESGVGGAAGAGLEAAGALGQGLSASQYAALQAGGAMSSGSGWGDIITGLKPADYLKGGLSIASGLMGANATDRATDAAVGASNNAISEQRRQFDQNRADLLPYMKTGYSANARLARLLGIDPTQAGESGYGDLTRRFTMADRDADPVYQSGLQFGLDEGRKGINARATATGNWDSGSTLKALTRYGNDYGSTKANDSFNRWNTESGNIYNRLAGVSGAGQTATGTVVNSGTSTANNVANLQTGIGNAQAAGVVGGNNAWANAIGGVSGAINDAESRSIIERLLRR